MPTTKYTGEEQYFSYDEIMDAMSQYLGNQVAGLALEEIANWVSQELREKVMEAVCRRFATMAATSYNQVAFLFNGLITVGELYEFGKAYLTWNDLATKMDSMTEDQTLVARMDIYYWEAGSGNSYTKYAKWKFYVIDN